jgi:predicted transcriptional regulator
MTKLFDQAVIAARRLPDAMQDEIARLVLHLSQRSDEPEEIDPAHLPAVLVGLAQAERGEFATEAELEAAFRGFDP